MHRSVLIRFTACVIAVGVMAGCSQSPQDRYDDAVSSLNSSRSDLNDAENRVEEARQRIQQAQQSFQQAQQQLQSLRQEVQQDTQSVAESATDQVLFRVLQRDVLNKSDFSDAAISVGVEQRVVTLTGSVPDKSTRQKAVKLVSNQPGVAHVVDRLQVGDSADAAPNSNNNSN